MNFAIGCAMRPPLSRLTDGWRCWRDWRHTISHCRISAALRPPSLMPPRGSPRQRPKRRGTLAKEHGVELTLVASLIHPALFEYQYRSDGGKGTFEFLSALRHAAIRHGISAWYFSPFSPITRDTPHWYFGKADRKDFYDPGHVTKVIGTKMMERIFEGSEQKDLRSYRLDQVRAEDVMKDMLADRRDRLRDATLPFDEFLSAHPLKAGQACPPS